MSDKNNILTGGRRRGGKIQHEEEVEMSSLLIGISTLRLDRPLTTISVQLLRAITSSGMDVDMGKRDEEDEEEEGCPCSTLVHCRRLLLSLLDSLPRRYLSLQTAVAVAVALAGGRSSMDFPEQQQQRNQQRKQNQVE